MPCPNLTYIRTQSIANSTRKRMQTQINAHKLIIVIDAWAISACKRDCVLCVRSKTFRMYYTCTYIYCIFYIKRPGSIFLAAYLSGVYWRLTLIRGRRLFSHVQISRVLVLHLMHIALAHMASLGSDYYEKASVVKGHPIYKAVWTTFTRASATWILRHAPHLRVC